MAIHSQESLNIIICKHKFIKIYKQMISQKPSKEKILFSILPNDSIKEFQYFDYSGVLETNA